MTLTFPLMPVQDFMSLRQAMDQLFERSFIRAVPGAVAVPIDLVEETDRFVLTADVPGIAPEQLKVQATTDSVSVSGEIAQQHEDKGAAYIRQERIAGKFERAFTLPVAIEPDKVEATFRNGVLTLILPKAASVLPKQVTVKALASGAAAA